MEQGLHLISVWDPKTGRAPNSITSSGQIRVKVAGRHVEASTGQSGLCKGGNATSQSVAMSEGRRKSHVDPQVTKPQGVTQGNGVVVVLVVLE